MAETLSLDDLVGMGKFTMEAMRSTEGMGIFEPTLLAIYEDGHSEVTLLVGGLDSETLTEGLIHVSKQGSLASLVLTADASLRDTDMDALIVLQVGEDGQPRTAMAPYILERTAHKAIIVWDDTVYTDSDPRLAAAMQVALASSRATMDG